MLSTGRCLVYRRLQPAASSRWPSVDRSPTTYAGFQANAPGADLDWDGESLFPKQRLLEVLNTCLTRELMLHCLQEKVIQLFNAPLVNCCSTSIFCQRYE